MITHHELAFATPGRGTYELTDDVQRIVGRAGVARGLCNLFIHHTSASVLITENADPAVHRDLGAFMQRLCPDGDPLFEHDDEGPDDMPAHVRSALTQTSISIPIAGGRCDLGTWQGIYLWEHRKAPHKRRITVTIIGE